MSEPIPKTIPRSTLACPPAKNFTDQYIKSTNPQQAQILSQKPSASTFEKVGKKEADKDLNLKPLGKDSNTLKAENTNFGMSNSNFRTSSKDIKQPSTKNLAIVKDPPSAKKGIDLFNAEKGFMHSEVHVKKWVDYSTKYGLGYLLSDGSTGVYFNDSTKIIVDKNGENFEYIEKKAGDKADTITPYKLSDYPPER